MRDKRLVRRKIAPLRGMFQDTVVLYNLTGDIFSNLVTSSVLDKDMASLVMHDLVFTFLLLYCYCFHPYPYSSSAFSGLYDSWSPIKCYQVIGYLL